MGINTSKKIIRVLSRAGIPAFLVGVHGIGKTSAIYQLYREAAAEAGKEAGDFNEVMSSIDAKALTREPKSPDDYGLWSVSAANITTEELIGMPDVEDRDAIYRQVFLDTLQAASRMSDDVIMLKTSHKQVFEYACKSLGVSEEDRGRRVLRYLRMNALLPDPNHRGGGMWCIDELNLGFVEVEKALMQILLEGRYLDYVLPDNIWVVTTMNPPSEEYPGARELALPTVDRGAMITISPDKGEWLKWATKRGLSEASRLFVDKHDKLLNVKMNLDSYTNPGTYRSVEWVDRAYSVMTEKEIVEIGFHVAISLLGPEAGPVYHRTQTQKRDISPLSLEEVIDGYGWKEDGPKDFREWEVTESRGRLLAMLKKANVKTELIRYTLNELEVWLKSDEDHGHGQLLNVMVFLHDLPMDISRGFMVGELGSDVSMELFSSLVSYPVFGALYKRIDQEYREAR